MLPVLLQNEMGDMDQSGGSDLSRQTGVISLDVKECTTRDKFTVRKEVLGPYAESLESLSDL